MTTERERLNHPELFPGQSAVREVFRKMEDEAAAIVLMTHRSDHLVNLREMGLLTRRLDLMSAHIDFGLEQPIENLPPRKVGTTYEDYYLRCDPEVPERIVQLAQDGPVYVFMPFPNLQLEEKVRQSPHPERVRMLIHSGEQLVGVENKRNFTEMMDDLPAEHQIPYFYLDDKKVSFKEATTRLACQGLVIQGFNSAGGDKTSLVFSGPEYQREVNRIRSMSSADGQVLKVAAFIDGYDSNISFVVTPSGEVLVDTPSRKTIGLEALGTKGASGNGHDWHYSFPSDMLRRYLKLTERVGKQIWYNYGYVGLAGLESMVTTHQDHGTIQPHEINPRTQGTTPYITINAIRNGRLPLEVAHYLAYLNPDLLEELVPSPNDYNRQAIAETEGCFYLKCGNPTKQPIVIKENMTGSYNIQEGRLEPITDRSLFQTLVAKSPNAIYLKGPQAGTVFKDALSPFAYICGQGIPVFEKDEPGLTPEAQQIVTLVYDHFVETA